MPEDFDLSNLDPSDPDAIRHLSEAYERSQARAQKAEQEAAEHQSALRDTQVKGIFDGLKAPGKLAELYPKDAEVSESAVKNFLQDKVGLSADDMNAWTRYQNLTGSQEPLMPAEDEDEIWAKKEMEATRKFYKGQYQPTDEERKALDDAKDKLFRKLTQWDSEVASGKRDPIIDPQGYGGFIDPPPWARRATHHVTQGN